MRKILFITTFLFLNLLLKAQLTSCVTTSINGLGYNDTIYIPCGETSVNLSVTYTDIRATNTYSVDSIPYYNYPYNGGIQVDPDIFESISGDDAWSNEVILPVMSTTWPFPYHTKFCFFDNSYERFIIGSNGIISFPPYGIFNSIGGPCPYEISSTANVLLDGPTISINQPPYDIINCLMSPYHDLNPSTDADTNIFYQIYDTYPCRKFVISYYNVPMYDCDTQLATHQIVLHESTNIIDINILHKPICSWNGGNAIEGIKSDNNLLIVPGRDYPIQWIVDSSSYRFSPNGLPTANTTLWYDYSNGVMLIGTGDTLNNVTPGLYMAKVSYNNCGDDSSFYIKNTVLVLPSNSISFAQTIVDNNLCYGDSSGGIMQFMSGLGGGLGGGLVFIWTNQNGDTIPSHINSIDSLSAGIYNLSVDVIFSVEADAKNQNKTTIKINSKSGVQIAYKIDEPKHESVRKEMGRGRLLFYVTFKEGTAYLDVANLCGVLGINQQDF